MPDVVKIDQHTQHRIERTDKIFRLSLIAALLLVIIMFALILVQNQINSNRALENATRNLELSREQAARNHKRTQDYVKCVAEALTVQIPQRNLDQCTQTVDNETKAVN